MKRKKERINCKWKVNLLTFSSNYFNGKKLLIRFSHLLEKEEGGKEERIELKKDFFGVSVFENRINKIEVYSLSLLKKQMELKSDFIVIQPMEVITLLVDLKDTKQQEEMRFNFDLIEAFYF